MPLHDGQCTLTRQQMRPCASSARLSLRCAGEGEGLPLCLMPPGERVGGEHGAHVQYVCVCAFSFAANSPTIFTPPIRISSLLDLALFPYLFAGHKTQTCCCCPGSSFFLSFFLWTLIHWLFHCFSGHWCHANEGLSVRNIRHRRRQAPFHFEVSPASDSSFSLPRRRSTVAVVRWQLPLLVICVQVSRQVGQFSGKQLDNNLSITACRQPVVITTNATKSGRQVYTFRLSLSRWHITSKTNCLFASITLSLLLEGRHLH